MCFIRVFDQILAEQLYREKGLLSHWFFSHTWLCFSFASFMLLRKKYWSYFLEMSKNDPRRKYRSTTAERRVVFAVCDGCVSSPGLEVRLDAFVQKVII